MNAAGYQEHQGVGDEDRVPEEAVKAHEVPDGISRPVRKDERTDRASHQEGEANFAEGLAEARLFNRCLMVPAAVADAGTCDAVVFRQEGMQQIHKDRKAAQVQGEVRDGHAASGEEEDVSADVAQKEGYCCDAENLVLLSCCPPLEIEAEGGDEGSADCEHGIVLPSEEAKADCVVVLGEVRALEPEVAKHRVGAFLFFHYLRFMKN